MLMSFVPLTLLIFCILCSFFWFTLRFHTWVFPASTFHSQILTAWLSQRIPSNTIIYTLTSPAAALHLFPSYKLCLLVNHHHFYTDIIWMNLRELLLNPSKTECVSKLFKLMFLAMMSSRFTSNFNASKTHWHVSLQSHENQTTNWLQ